MIEPLPGEKLLSSQLRAVKVTGFLSPFRHNDQPWVLKMPNNPSCWIAIFSSVEKLEEACADLNIRDYKIKQITDGRDFVESIIEQGVRIMLDPYAIRSENKTRWTEVVMG